MAAGIKTGGRQKGTPNKLTAAVRSVISQAAEELGGVDRLVAWAKEDPANERVFWSSIYTKLVGASGTQDDPIHNEHSVSGLKPIYGLQPPAET